MPRTLHLALLVGLLLPACMDTPRPEPDAAPGAAQVRIGSVDWYVDYEAAVEVARAQRKALWVHFGEDPG